MTQADPNSQPPKPKVLFADSSRLMRRSAERILGDEFSIVLASNLEQAWVELQNDSLIQVVFCDLAGADSRPDLSLIEHMHNSGSRRIRETSIVLMLDEDEDERIREQALQLGVSDFITKPFRPSELKARARALANKSESIQRLRELQKQHNKDAETGLGNRRYFFERLAQALSFARRHGQALSLVHVHLDGLDQARQRPDSPALPIAELGRVLGDAIRHEDTVYRTGPETFSFILPGTGADGAETVRCRLAPELDGLGMLNSGGELGVQSRFIVQSPSMDEEEPLVETVRQIRTSMGSLPVRPAEEPTSPTTPASELDELIELARHGDHEALQRRLPEVLERLKPLLELAAELEHLRDPNGKGKRG